MSTSIFGFRDKPKYDRHKYLPISGQVQNVQNSRVYIFGDADIAEDEINTDNEIELSKVRSRGDGKRKTKTKNTEKDASVIVERDILDGDTLQTFALQYGCPVSELKRINNLIKDQDFFALRKLKVPLRQHGLLLEEEEERRRRPEGFDDDAAGTSNHVGPSLVNGHKHSMEGGDFNSDSDDSQTEFVRTMSIRSSLDGDDDLAEKFLRKMDKDLQRIVENTTTHKDSLEEVTSVLKETRFRPLVFPKRTDCPNDGATCGCTFLNVVIVLVIVVIVVPILGLVYELVLKKDGH